MEFTPYHGTRVVNAGPCATVRKNGAIAISAAAHALIGTPPVVQLGFITETNMVGIWPAVEGRGREYKVRLNDTGTASVNASGFSKYNKIVPLKAVTFDAVEVDGVLTFAVEPPAFVEGALEDTRVLEEIEAQAETTSTRKGKKGSK